MGKNKCIFLQLGTKRKKIVSKTITYKKEGDW